MPYITIGTAKFFYSTSEDQTVMETPIVFLHGSGGDGTVWDEQRCLAEGGVRTVIVDLPGHGRSAGPLLNSIADYAGWLDTLTSAIQLPPFFLAGHSSGGAIAQEYGHAFPQKVQGLILIGCGTMLRASHTYVDTFKNNFQEALQTACGLAFAANTPLALFRKGFEMLARNGRETLYRDIASCRAFSSKPWISSVKVPALIVCGAEDKITPPLLSEELACSLPKGELKVIPGAGHMVMMEAPEVFNNAVKDFIKRHQS